MKVSLKHINTLQTDKSIKALALALAVKEMYVSSAVKNYNPHSLQKKLAQSNIRLHHTTIKKYVQVLIRLGVAVIKNDCLIIKKLHFGRKDRVNIKKGLAKSFKDYVHLVRGQQIIRKIWQAKYVYDKRCLSQKILKNPRSIKAYRQAKRSVEKYGTLGADETSFEYKQSILSFCKMFNCSIGEFYTTLKYLIKKKLIKVQQNIKLLCRYNGGELDLPNCFIRNGWIYQVNCNTYSYKSFKNKDSKK